MINPNHFDCDCPECIMPEPALCECGAPVTVGAVVAGIPDDYCAKCWAPFAYALGMAKVHGHEGQYCGDVDCEKL